ncbi:MAG: 50S ribosomal protein L4, partial [Acidobacteria bacterium]|nr:50S ribosomal protein L4 [Acidobacteriota bacterium]
RGALRAALADRFQAGAVVVVEELALEEAKTKRAAELFARLGASGRTLVIDVQPDERLIRSTRNLAAIRLVPSGRVTARDVLESAKLIVTRAALEQLQAALGGAHAS